MPTELLLSQKQRVFTQLVAGLIQEVARRGWGVTFGEAWRSPEEAARQAKAGGGIARSLHTQRLAIDLNLFINEVYQDDSAAYLPLGEWWEAQSTAAYTCAWGGRFHDAQGRPKPDGNHFSIAHEGRR